MTLATFGAGCFWHVEAAFRSLPGVVNATSGYMGGTLKNPSYDDVCSDNTGHAEVVQVEYDEKKISYEVVLKAFWKMHDPTQKNRQGPDFGTQYRSVIFYHDEEQKNVAQSSKEVIQKKLGKPVATEIVKAQTFYRAEEYHQNYFEKHGKVCGI